MLCTGLLGALSAVTGTRQLLQFVEQVDIALPQQHERQVPASSIALANKQKFETVAVLQCALTYGSKLQHAYTIRLMQSQERLLLSSRV